MNINRNFIMIILVVLVHYIIFVSFVLSFLLSLLYFPWFIALTINSLIVRVIFSRSECPLTTLENKYRKKLDILESKGFLKDYLIFPKRTFTYLLSKLK